MGSASCIGTIEGNATDQSSDEQSATIGVTDRPLHPAATGLSLRGDPQGTTVATDGSGTPPPASTDGWMTKDQRRRADMLISLFENGTVDIRYDYVQALGDGRGYTAGRGFTTGTGDVLAVVKLFDSRVSSNPLGTYLPRLEELASEGSGSTSGLSGFVSAWKTAATDPEFRRSQDDIVDRDSYFVAMKTCDSLGINTALGRTVIYDTVVVHGSGGDPDGLPALVSATLKIVASPNAAGTDEKLWMRAFLKVRRADMAHAHDPATRKVWAEAVGRCDVLAELDRSANYDLHGPIEVKGEYQGTVP
ncbi:MAG: chitosanase [Polyangiales bacterium]